MKTDSVQQFVALRESLLREKAALEARLAKIKSALENQAVAVHRATAVPAKRPKRVENSMSLRTAVTQVTRVKPLTKVEILAAVKKIGYRFAASNPVNSLNTLLYTKGLFDKKGGGKFIPGKLS